MTQRPTRIEFVILGEPASKANSREIVTRKVRDKATGELVTKPMSRKSDKALAYEADALRQIPPKARVQLTGPCRIALRIWYASERPDLDESVILDCLQDRYESIDLPTGKVRTLVHRGVVKNDRQFRQRVVLHGIDRENPRAHIVIEPLQAQQIALALGDAFDPFDLLTP
jgi:Holliday junction resolvase RusA-like endonuclease